MNEEAKVVKLARAAERERLIMAAFNLLLDRHYWVSRPVDGRLWLMRTRLSEQGKFYGLREQVRVLEATEPQAALLEAAAYVKTL